MLSLAFQSFWLWYLAGVALWTFIGLLVAARFGLPIVIGAGLGALFWIGGIAVLLIVGLAHRGRGRQVRDTFAADGPTTNAFRAPGAGFGAGAAFPPAGGQFPQPGTGFPAPVGSFFPSLGGSTSVGGFPGAGFPAAGGGFPAAYSDGTVPPGGRPASVPQSRNRERFPASTRQVAIAIVGLGALGIFVSIALPWGQGSVAWSRSHSTASGGVSPASAFPIAFVIALSGVIVIMSGVLMHRRPHIVWPILAAATTTWWFCVVFEWLFVESHAAGLARSADHFAGNQGAVSVSTASGVWIMLVGCCAIYAWCVLVSYDLVRGNTARMSDYSGRRQTALGL